MTTIFSQCMNCTHFKKFDATGVGTCAAYPDGDGIPEKILFNAQDHRQPQPGDHGIQWEAENAELGHPFAAVSA